MLRLERPHFPLLTRRLALRPLREDDADISAVSSYRSLATVMQYTSRPPMSRDDVVTHIASVSSGAPSSDGEWLGLAVERRADGVVIGEASLKFALINLAQGEIGYVFTPEVAGQGFATEAAAALLDLAFEHYGFHRVIARIDEENVASVRVAERLGMRLEARLVENDRRDGRWTTEVDYAVLDREWCPSQAGAQ